MASMFFTREGLAAVKQPMLVFTPKTDSINNAALHGELIKRNLPLPPGGLEDPDTLDFRPLGASLLRRLTSPAGSARGVSLQPEAEFALPIGTRPIKPPAQWLPGALQSGQ